MKILRIVHGLANNFVDCEVPDEFSILGWYRDVQHNGYCIDGAGKFIINTQWVQHAVLLTKDERDNLAPPKPGERPN